MMCRKVYSIVAVVILIYLASLAEARVLRVGPHGDFSWIHQAIYYASEGDTI